LTTQDGNKEHHDPQFMQAHSRTYSLVLKNLSLILREGKKIVFAQGLRRQYVIKLRGALSIPRRIISPIAASID
jgi:hypothetical protein